MNLSDRINADKMNVILKLIIALKRIGYISDFQGRNGELKSKSRANDGGKIKSQ